ncbi:MAG: hypothetical protein COV07_01235 [Candidatus Vogelbacteria bacterium CG10_big_fil_rev_8_21_14_0_10_45_14]|uniref:Methyltransferase domain-containing protein n=1 Tax=Candidatus Vogelbacteria bacterium CG10_big_fil_rev_8_21_14_0_10_45_14 TaxID=1975042 RepID=A0A2H0RLY9_9BACT|nr:MAG: hypothetical protein COV07_01235 [Candidatus Vogelbacteria bacterium CG10_big_fil_rev_8_21_14_0_10_45_14]
MFEDNFCGGFCPHEGIDCGGGVGDNVYVAFSDPKENISHLHFPASGTVVDIGAGSGHHAIELALRLREMDGKVIAIDIQKDLLQRVKTEALRLGLDNIETIWGDAEEMRGTELGDASCDAALVSNVLFQLEERDVFAQELWRIVKSGGEVLIVDWSDGFGGMGPKPEVLVSRNDTEALFVRHGFRLKDSFDAGDHHFGILFERVDTM